MNFILLDKSVI